MTDTDILLGGFGLFGGRGEYTGKIKLLDIGPDGGEQEGDGDVLAETEEIPYECGPRQKYPMLFDEPVSLQVSLILHICSQRFLCAVLTGSNLRLKLRSFFVNSFYELICDPKKKYVFIFSKCSVAHKIVYHIIYDKYFLTFFIVKIGKLTFGPSCKLYHKVEKRNC